MLDSALYLDLIGTPWKLHARGPESLDCIGLLLAICGRRGLLIRGLDSHPAQIERAEEEWRQVARSSIAPGDALLFRSTNPRWHVGVAIDEYRMVHSSEASGGVVVERYDSPKFARRLESVYRCRVSPSVP